jgi:hypothetical protein
MKNFIEVNNARNHGESVSINVANITCIKANIRGECVIHTSDGHSVATEESYQALKDKINNAI